ncbi:hypothetical protein M9Y10_004593 [Tritrichomonas musculus]|uniref:Phosphatidylinositol-specific phospholipase C X domain-containing protein n=1 Tax=Tritrichomonas musculus TaxID=1915356 RepID=A0ABR2JJF9_9EUKA
MQTSEDPKNYEAKVAKDIYDYDFIPSNQRPEPRHSKIRTFNDLKPADWLSGIDGSKKINTLSIPGTHDSGARFRGPFSQCQSLSILEQLLNGVRYLDIRCRHVKNCFMIHHTRKFQYLGFGSGVRDIIFDFLRDHPTEFVFVQIKPEYYDQENTRSFFETMKAYIDPYVDRFYLEETLPTLDQVRGKIVLLRRFESPITPFGILLNFKNNSTFTSETSITARIQDEYKVKSLFHRQQKWDTFLSHLTEAKENEDEDKLFINFGSGSTTFCYPFSTANFMTPKIGDYLKNQDPNSFVGIIMLDYFTENYENIAYYLIKRNFK